MTATTSVAQSPRRRFWGRMFKNPLGIFSMIWFVILLIAWVWPELLATHDPLQQDVTLQRLFEGPSRDHWLGTDQLGRDWYSRVIFGAGYAFRSILIAMTIAVVVGVPLGLFSGWRGGRVDRAIMWVNDVLFSLPIILLAMAVIIILTPSLDNAMIGVGIAMSTRFTRLTRAVTLQEKEELYVDSARITGLSTPNDSRPLHRAEPVVIAHRSGGHHLGRHHLDRRHAELPRDRRESRRPRLGRHVEPLP